jgi:hypothetical protein
MLGTALAAELLAENLAKLIVIPILAANIGFQLWGMRKVTRWFHGI